ncbi:hypothetical protein Avbf_12775 [Armadillidium vulgare]|nr:hypothetical protein Avbf_12775 [Armadillidium vulgare]
MNINQSYVNTYSEYEHSLGVNIKPESEEVKEEDYEPKQLYIADDQPVWNDNRLPVKEKDRDYYVLPFALSN